MNHHLSQRLRELTQELRRTPKPLAEIIPLLNQAADELDRRAPAPTSEPGARDAVLELAASTIELFDDATMLADYMLDSGECAGIIRALKEFTPASPAVPSDAGIPASVPSPAPAAPSVDQATRSIIVRITANDEGYEDVHPDLMMEDAMRVNPYGWPQGFSFEVVDQAKRLVDGEVAAPWISVDDEAKPIGRKPILVAVSYVRFGEHEDGTPGEYHGQQVTEGEYIPAFGKREEWFSAYASPIADQEWITHWMYLPDAPDRASTGSATSTDTKESA